MLCDRGVSKIAQGPAPARRFGCRGDATLAAPHDPGVDRDRAQKPPPAHTPWCRVNATRATP
eukprot:9498097-Pyramimonas_sp.AAC.1